jgi:hypothetical protein
MSWGRPTARLFALSSCNPKKSTGTPSKQTSFCDNQACEIQTLRRGQQINSLGLVTKLNDSRQALRLETKIALRGNNPLAILWARLQPNIKILGVSGTPMMGNCITAYHKVAGVIRSGSIIRKGFWGKIDQHPC